MTIFLSFIYIMDFLLFLATFVLFFVLTPGVILSLPPKGSKLVTALVHALLFAILLTLFMECFKTDDKEGMMLMTKYPEDVSESDHAHFDVVGRRPAPYVGDEITGDDGEGYGTRRTLRSSEPYIIATTRQRKRLEHEQPLLWHHNDYMK